jgi:hypothetical protein
VPVLFLIAIVVVLVGIFFAATGRGGELSREPADHAPLDLGPVSAADVALLRPPTAMWGYNMQVTDEALDQIARAMRERDVTISYLQDQLAGYGSYAEPRGVRARLDPEASDDAGTRATPEIAGALGIAGAAAIADAGGTRGAEIADFGETRATPEFFGIAEMFGPTGGYGAPDVLESSDTLESHDARQFPEDLEISHSPEEREPLGTLGPVEPLESPEPPAAAELPATELPATELPATEPAAAEPPTAEHPAAEHPAAEPPTAAATAAQAPGPPQTPLVLKASRPKPEPHEPTQPSQILSDPEEAHDATEPSAVLSHDEEADEATQPAAAPAPDEAPGPQGAFDTHGWWAQQKEAAREEQVQRQGSGEQNGDSVAAAEEQGR